MFHLGGAKVTPGCGDAGLKGGRWSPLPSKPCSGARGGAAHGSLSDHHALNQTPRSRLPHQARDHAVGDPHTPGHREATESAAQENGGATGCLSALRPPTDLFLLLSLQLLSLQMKVPNQPYPRTTRGGLPCRCLSVTALWGTWLHGDPSHPWPLKEPLPLRSSTADGAKDETQAEGPGNRLAQREAAQVTADGV